MSASDLVEKTPDTLVRAARSTGLGVGRRLANAVDPERDVRLNAVGDLEHSALWDELLLVRREAHDGPRRKSRMLVSV